MNRLAKLSARFIGEQGFSIGIDDVTPAQQLKAGLFSDRQLSCIITPSFVLSENVFQFACKIISAAEAGLEGSLSCSSAPHGHQMNVCILNKHEWESRQQKALCRRKWPASC